MGDSWTSPSLLLRFILNGLRMHAARGEMRARGSRCVSELSPSSKVAPLVPSVASVGACSCRPGSCACDAAGFSVTTEVCLTSLEAGQVGLLTRTTLGDGDAALLRAMGLRPKARVRLCQAGEPWIIEVRRSGGACSRIGLARAIAAHVFLGPV